MILTPSHPCLTLFSLNFREEKDVTAAKISSLEAEVELLTQSLATGREERERVEREVEREKRGREEAEEKVEELKKTIVEKNDDIQAKTKMIAKVHIYSVEPL